MSEKRVTLRDVAAAAAGSRGRGRARPLRPLYSAGSTAYPMITKGFPLTKGESFV